jgi:outer membrane protein TolC
MKNGLKIAAFLSLACLINGCARESAIEPRSGEHLTLIQQDQTYLNTLNNADLPQNISVETAVQRALDKNLDAYVSSLETLIASNNTTLERLAVLPNITASGNFIERSDEAASSSESIITRTESLEPSTSTDQEKRTANLSFQWNLLDSAVALLEGKIADNNEVIALERLRKIKHNIERDVTNAYWKAYAYQETREDLDAVIDRLNTTLTQIDTAQTQKLLSIDEVAQRTSQLSEKDQSLSALQEEIRLADIELRSLASLPSNTEIHLSGTPSELEKAHKTLLAEDVDALIAQALQDRPEIRESIANRNIAGENVKREILGSFPALGVVYGLNYDSNSFLTEQNWEDFNISLVQSITSFLTLPKRYKAARDRKQLVEAQRLALTAAIIAQIHVGKLRVNVTERHYKTANILYKNASRKALLTASRANLNSASTFENTNAKADLLTQRIQKDIAYADLQKAYADLLSSMGRSLYPTTVGKEVIDEAS